MYISFARQNGSAEKIYNEQLQMSPKSLSIHSTPQLFIFQSLFEFKLYFLNKTNSDYD